MGVPCSGHRSAFGCCPPLPPAAASPRLLLSAMFLLQLELEQVAGAYANALVEVAQKTSSLEAVHADVDTLAGVLKDNEVGAAAWVLACCPQPAAAMTTAAAALLLQLLAPTKSAPVCCQRGSCFHGGSGSTAAPGQLQPPLAYLLRLILSALFQHAQALKEMLANPCILEDKKKAVVKSLASEASFSQVGAA